MGLACDLAMEHPLSSIYPALEAECLEAEGPEVGLRVPDGLGEQNLSTRRRLEHVAYL